MKIYFCGAHSTGKSTLARYVSEKYNLPMISETARMILSEQELQIDSLRCNMDVANKYQKEVFERQILEEQKHMSFVSDRSIIDVLAYTAQHTNVLRELLDHTSLTDYITKLLAPDSILFFVSPAKATLSADGVREAINWDGVISINAMIKLLLEMFKIRYFQINVESMQERTKLIDSILSLQNN